jgi:hypothetical protein
MPLGAGTTDKQTDSNKPQKEQEKSFSDHVEIIAGWVVDIISIPFQFCGAIMSQFVQPGTSGAKILGFVMFLGGVLLSADGVWQTLFQGKPLFPWFETDWIGWMGWLTVWVNPLFWFSIVISWGIQQAEAKTLRGKAPSLAKQEFENVKQYNLEKKPQGSIDLAKALWGDYKRAGMRERNSGGLIALLIWMLDIACTFYGRNPFGFIAPVLILGCLIYNLATMMAGEIGYNLWKHSRK